jgi:hypothetical protein
MPNSVAIDISIIMGSRFWVFDRNFDIIPKDIREYFSSVYGHWLGYGERVEGIGRIEFLLDNTTGILLCKWSNNSLIFYHNDHILDEATYRKLMLVS